jgi:hypothetical protein
MKLLKNKKSLAIIIASMIASNALTYYSAKKNTANLEQQNAISCDNNYDVARLDGYKYVKTIMYVD